MSDYYRSQKDTNQPFAGWQQGHAGDSFLTDDPAQLGAQMQQGGVPLYPNTEFLSDDAPTRVARPVLPQTVNRRTTTALPTQSEAAETPAQESAPAAEAPVRRRRSRVAERAQSENEMEAPAPQLPQTPVQQPMTDPFQAGDSEESTYARPQAARARSAAPAQQPVQQRPVRARNAADERPVQRPAQPAQRPAQMGQRPAQQRPAQAAQRPAQQPMRRPAQQPLQEEAIPPQRYEEQRPQHPAARLPKDEEFRRKKKPPVEDEYDDDDEDEDDEDEEGGSLLLPILLLLVVIAGMIAGICVPDWNKIGGPVGSKIAPIKQGIVGVFESVKEKILPEDEAVKSFSATAADSTAPTQVLFTVQTAKNVQSIRIVDDFGQTVYTGAYSAEKEATGEVISNSNVLLWKPSCTVEEGYEGSYTIYAVKNNGKETEGLVCAMPVNIAASKQQEPAVQAFACDTAISAIPAEITFTITTSDAVSAVRVVDDSNSPLINMYDTDENSDWGDMNEQDGKRVWTLSTEILGAYTGSYTAQYMLSDSSSFTPSEYSVAVQLGGEALETPAPVPVTQTPAVTATPAPTPTEAPTPTPTVAPTPTPTPSPTPTPTPVPTTSPLPDLSASASADADPAVLKLTATLYSGEKTISSYNRSRAINMLNAFTTTLGGSDYAGWKQAGVLTFRSGPLRQNAAYSTVEVENETLSVVWNQPIGSMKTSESTVYGVAAPGQPVIVKWPTELRRNMGMYDAAKEVTALKEAIVAGQDGKVHFFNLLTGDATRDPIELGAPSRGGLSVATNGTPILGVGQYNKKLANKTVNNGYHILDLVTNKKAKLIAGDGKDKNSNYSGFTGAALFDSTTGTMIVGGQNGVLYTAELGLLKDTYNYGVNKVTLDSAIQGYKSLTKDQKKTNTNIDASVAMYNNYVYFGDQDGIVQCVDVNTLTSVWAVDTEDNVDSTPALDVEDGTAVALYTGNTIANRTGKTAACTIRRLNALTGETEWTYEAPELIYQSKNAKTGVYASPVVGQESISDRVIFTVSYGNDAPSRVFALEKKTGKVIWETALEGLSISSPVAVYNEAGDAWIVQAEQNGKIHLINASSGKIVNSLQLTASEENAELEIEASPAVYGNLMVIGTTGKNAGGVYCIKID